MITYTKTNFWEVLFKQLNNLISLQYILTVSGTIILSYLITILNEENTINLNKYSSALNSTLSIYNFFLTMAISFKLNNAFSSWANGFASIGRLINLSKQFLTKIYSITNQNNYDHQQRRQLLLEINNNVLNYISHIFYMCGGGNGREDLDGLRSTFLPESDIKEIKSFNNKTLITRNFNHVLIKDILEMNLPNDTIFTMLEFRLRSNIKLLKNEKLIDLLYEIELNKMIDELATLCHKLYGIANIPVVHIYNQFINLSITTGIILFIFTLVPLTNYWIGVFVFLYSSLLILCNEVSNIIDTPFGNDRDDIELEIILNNIKCEFSIIYEESTKLNSDIAL